MKLNKFFTFAALATAMFFTASCSDEYSYDGRGAWDADTNFADLYFPTTSIKEEVDPNDATVATIELCRRNTEGELSVPMTIVENTDEVFEVSNANFADGDSVATITVKFPTAETGIPYTLSLQIEGSEYTSMYSENTLCTYTVTRVKWNDAGYYFTEDGDSIAGYAMYTDDFITTFFGVGNQVFPTKLQERADKPGYFRLINTYGELYPWNEPGDWDDSKDYYIYIDATDPKKVFIPELYETGMDWGYGNIRVYSFAGYYLAAGKASDAEEYYGTYENGAITFPTNSLMLNMPLYNATGLYTANGSGAFKLVVDPSKDLYTATIKDYEFSELLFEGDFTSAQQGTKKNSVAIYKGIPKEDVEAANEGCYERFEAKYGGTPYLIKSPYTDGYNLLFLVNGGRIIPMEGYELQSTGMIAFNQEVYAAILGTSKFSEKEVSLDIRFQTKPDSKGNYTDFGTATETLEYVSWTQVGTGIYTYTAYFCEFDEDENPIPEEDGPLDIYQRDDQPNVYKITHWGYDVDFTFTWDGEDGDGVTVPTSATGDVHPQYGPIYVSDVPTWSNGGYSYEQFPCLYDAETSTFSFTVAYWDMDDPSYPWGVDEETFQVTWGDAAPAAARAAKAKNLQVKSKKTASNLKGNCRKNPFANGKNVKAEDVKTLKISAATPAFVK